MSQIPAKQSRAVATSLRTAAVENKVRSQDVQRIAQKHRIQAGDVIGIAREILIDVEAARPVRSESHPGRVAGKAEAGQGKPPVSALVRDQILKGGIYRTLLPLGIAEDPDKVQVLTTYGQFRRERQAIKDWVSALERENEELRRQTARLKAELEGQDAGPAALDDAEIARRDPHSFFRDPRDQ